MRENQLDKTRLRSQRCLATNNHISDLRHRQALCDHLHLSLRPQRLDKRHVGSGLDKGLSTVKRGLDAIDCAGIGARDDHGIFILSGINGRLNLGHGFLNRYYSFSREMPAFLGKNLILYLHCKAARALNQAHGSAGVDGVAKAGIDIDNKWQVADFGNGRYGGRKFGKCD